jgi:hypothetical protein
MYIYCERELGILHDRRQGDETDSALICALRLMRQCLSTVFGSVWRRQVCEGSLEYRWTTLGWIRYSHICIAEFHGSR